MAERLLSDRACKAAKGKAAIFYKSDGNGLRLQVRPDGAKYWMLRYTLKAKESTLGLGPYSEVGLEEARRKAADARKLIAEGIHPSVDRKARRARNVERGEATFKVVAEEWLARHREIWSGHHHERNKGLIDRILVPTLGALPVTEITEQVLLKALLKYYDAGKKESARRARAVAQQVFQYARDTHRVTHNPARDLAGSSLLKKPDVKHFAAIKPDQVGPMLRKLAESEVAPVTQAALRLMLYTGLRDAALRAATWGEIDLDGAVWTVPLQRRKTRRTTDVAEFRLPLPRQAVAELTELARLTDLGPESYVFASHGKAGYLAENTLRLALHGLGFKVTAHGFRSLLTDVLNEHEFNADAIERQLDHAPKDQVRAAYLRTDFFEHRRAMMQWVADWADARMTDSTEESPSSTRP